jgi:hypothetical protein
MVDTEKRNVSCAISAGSREKVRGRKTLAGESSSCTNCPKQYKRQCY